MSVLSADQTDIASRIVVAEMEAIGTPMASRTPPLHLDEEYSSLQTPDSRGTEAVA